MRARLGWLLLPLRLVTLAGGLGPAARLALTVLAMPLLEGDLRRRGRTAGVTLVLGGQAVRFAVDSMADLHALAEVCAAGAYDIPEIDRAGVIVDVGANIGASVAYFATRRPGVLLHAYEPDPRAFAKLRRNVGHLPDVILHPEAIGGQEGTATFFSSAQAWSSSLVRRPDDAADAVEVVVRTLPAALRAAGLQRVDLLKLDAEGAEYDVLRHPGALDGVATVVGEVHPGLVPGEDVASFVALLPGFRVDVERDHGGGQMGFTARRTSR